MKIWCLSLGLEDFLPPSPCLCPALSIGVGIGRNNILPYFDDGSYDMWHVWCSALNQGNQIMRGL